jgi:hypothetical protein
MRRSLRAAWVALFALAGLALWAPVTAAQTGLSKILVGTWQGELRLRKSNTDLLLRITSVKQEDGKWTADGRFGPNPVKIDIDTSGSKPSLRWTGAAGHVYDLSLVDDKNLVGTATLTTSLAGQFERERPVKLEKKQ